VSRREPLFVFFDGACAVCTDSIAWALRRDAFQRLHPVPAGSPRAADLVGPEHAGRLLEELHVWSESRGLCRGADAIVAILHELPGLGWAGRLLAMPLLRPFNRIAYRGFARWRRSRPPREATVYRAVRRPLTW
jgi:predicted DCC family thiol-disulfide oxidoreductase YuxK